MSIGNADYASDITIWYQVVIDSSNDTIVISDQALSSGTQVTLDHGLYFVSTDDSGPSDYSYLLTHIETKLDAAVSNAGGSHTYSFSLATPDLSSDYTDSTVSLSTSDGSAFTLEFSDSNFTTPRGVFGYTNIAFDQSSVSGTYQGDYTQYGRWQAPPDHYPQDQRDLTDSVVYSSGGSPATEGRLGGYDHLRRQFEWRALPAAVVYPSRAYDLTLSGGASLDRFDINNGLKDVYSARAYDMVLAQGTPSTNPDAFEVSPREVCKMPISGSFDELWEDVEGKERYDIQWIWEVVSRAGIDSDAYL